MIASVTLNPAVDKTITVPGFAVGKTNRCKVEQVDAGGKGINVAKAARRLGCPVIALGFLAGKNGYFISESLATWSIPSDFIFVPGETRVNLKITDPVGGTETEINEPGFQVDTEHLEQLKQRIAVNSRRCAVMVFSGSLPPGAPLDTYADFISVAKQSGCRAILDTGGAALKNGLAARPDLIKPNRAEVEELLQTKIESEQQLISAARRLLALGVGAAVISLGAEGALGASSDHLLRAKPPAVKARRSIAAGDAMVAGLACAMKKNLSFSEALRLGTAASAATVSMSGSNVAELKLIEELLPQVRIENLSWALSNGAQR